MKNIGNDRKFLIERLGYMRNRAGLSARELSGMIGKSTAYLAKFENGDFSIPAEILMEAVLCCGGNMEEFFSSNIHEYSRQKEVLGIYNNLSEDSKSAIINLMKTMK